MNQKTAQQRFPVFGPVDRCDAFFTNRTIFPLDSKDYNMNEPHNYRPYTPILREKKQKKRKITGKKHFFSPPQKALFNMNFQCKFTDITMIIPKYS